MCYCKPNYPAGRRKSILLADNIKNRLGRLGEHPLLRSRRSSTEKIVYLGMLRSGVTNLGVTRGGSWWCHLFPWKKTEALFSHILFSSPFDPIFPHRFSSVLSKFSHKRINFYSGAPWIGVTRGGPPEGPDLTGGRPGAQRRSFAVWGGAP